MKFDELAKLSKDLICPKCYKKEFSIVDCSEAEEDYEYDFICNNCDACFSTKDFFWYIDLTKNKEFSRKTQNEVLEEIKVREAQKIKVKQQKLKTGLSGIDWEVISSVSRPRPRPTTSGTVGVQLENPINWASPTFCYTVEENTFTNE
jgi:transcriptional regulator NrdR family protein